MTISSVKEIAKNINVIFSSGKDETGITKKVFDITNEMQSLIYVNDSLKSAIEIIKTAERTIEVFEKEILQNIPLLDTERANAAFAAYIFAKKISESLWLTLRKCEMLTSLKKEAIGPNPYPFVLSPLKDIRRCIF